MTKDHKATAVFAGGYFWCTEAAFEQLKGVSDVESGYAGGAKETANYEQVSNGDTGHAESIRVPTIRGRSLTINCSTPSSIPTTRLK